MPPPTRRVLVVGAYLADRENRAVHIAEELQRSRDWIVEQRWTAIGAPPPPEIARFTVDVSMVMEPIRFTRLNRLLAGVDPSTYAYVLVADDDVALPAGFLDGYLALVEKHDLALAQPARTHASYTDHHFVEQLLGIDARWTRFVEIGPLFSMRADAVPLLTPFDEQAPMGWGWDFVWPVMLERAGLQMGIVDAFPVAHDLRKVGGSYTADAARRQMAEVLARHDHLEPDEAFQIVRSFA